MGWRNAFRSGTGTFRVDGKGRDDTWFSRRLCCSWRLGCYQHGSHGNKRRSRGLSRHFDHWAWVDYPHGNGASDRCSGTTSSQRCSYRERDSRCATFHNGLDRPGSRWIDPDARCLPLFLVGSVDRYADTECPEHRERPLCLSNRQHSNNSKRLCRKRHQRHLQYWGVFRRRQFRDPWHGHEFRRKYPCRSEHHPDHRRINHLRTGNREECGGDDGYKYNIERLQQRWRL